MADPNGEVKKRQAAAAAVALLAVYEAARADVLAGVADGALRNLLAGRWAYRIAEVVEPYLKRTAAEVGRSTFADLDGAGEFDPARMDAYLEVGAIERGRGWVASVNESLNQLDALAEEFRDEVERTMNSFVRAADEDAVNIAESAGNFGSIEAAKEAGATNKTWHLGAGDNHRASHIALNGVTVGIDERFANGLRYPHAPGPPAETVNCNCYATFGR